MSQKFDDARRVAAEELTKRFSDEAIKQTIRDELHALLRIHVSMNMAQIMGELITNTLGSTAELVQQEYMSQATKLIDKALKGKRLEDLVDHWDFMKAATGIATKAMEGFDPVKLMLEVRPMLEQEMKNIATNSINKWVEERIFGRLDWFTTQMNDLSTRIQALEQRAMQR